MLRTGRVAERAQSGLLALLRKPPIDGPPGTVERAVDRGDGGVQLLGDLARREADHVAEDQNRALSRREMLQCSDEGELQGLSLFIAGLGRRVARLQPDLLVGIGLVPDRFGEWGARIIAGLGGGPRSIGSDRLGRRASAYRQTLVALLYSQGLSTRRPPKRGNARHALSSVSCSASSESCS